MVTQRSPLLLKYMKKFLLFSLVGLIAGSVMAQINPKEHTDYKLAKAVSDIQKGENTKNAIQTLRVSGSASVGGYAVDSQVQVLYGTFTSSTGAVTNAFSASFSTIPTVVIGFGTNGVAGKSPITSPTSVSAASFVYPSVATGTLMTYIAVGLK